MTSVLASRAVIDETQPVASPTGGEVDGEHAGPWPPKDSQVSISLLRFMEMLHVIKIGVQTDLEPVQHQETLGEGLSFSVKEHIRSAGKIKVLKVFKHNLAPGHSNRFEPKSFDTLMMEAYVLGHDPIKRHDNIVTLSCITWAVRSNDPIQVSPALEIERAPYGDLSSFQNSVPATKVPWHVRKMLCYDIAAGLEVLHGSGIVHGDLKGENVLIFDHPTRGYIAKISDFGSAVILPQSGTNSSPSVRMPAFTVPWNAPEVFKPIAVEKLHLTDVYSLGLFMWKVLVHADPFQVFDLPLHPTTRLHEIQKILDIPDLPGFIPQFIEEEVGFLELREVALLLRLFDCTVNKVPEQRNLQRVLELLFPHCGRASSEQVPVESMVAKIEPLPGFLQNISFDLAWIGKFHFVVQGQILAALEEFSGYAPLRHGKEPIPIRGGFELRERAVWNIFQCHLLGIGTEPNPQLAFDILFTAGLPEHGRFWKSWVLALPLRRALNIHVPESRMTMLTAMAMNATLASKFVQRVMDPDHYDEKPVPDDHGITCSKDSLKSLTKDLRLSKLSLQLDEQLEIVGGFAVGGGNSTLHAAAMYDLFDLAEIIIERELVAVNVTNDRQETPLLIACMYNSYDIIQLLLAKNADASIADFRGETGLYWLSSLPQQSAEGVCRQLRSSGAKLDLVLDLEAWENIGLLPDEFLFKCRARGGPMVTAVANNDLHVIQILVKVTREALEDNAKLMFLALQLPLRLAAELHLHKILEYLCLELVEILMTMQGMVDAESPSRDVADLLVGAMVHHLTESSAIVRGAIRMSHYAYRLCYHEERWKEAAKQTIRVLKRFGFVTSLIANHGLCSRTLNFTIASGNYEALEELLEEPKSFIGFIEVVDETHHIPPVHQALNSQKLEMLKLLIDKGATVDLRLNSDPAHNLSGVGASYLHVIASLRIADTTFGEILLDHHVPADIKDNRNFSALALALYRCSFNLASLLIERGADLNGAGYWGYSVLGEVFMSRQALQCDDLIATLRFCLRYDKPGEKSLFIVDSNSQRSILHAVAACSSLDEKTHNEALKLLLGHFYLPEQVNARATTESKSTPLQTAIAMRNPIAVAALIEAGADVQIKDPGGQSAMELAQNTASKLLAGQSLDGTKVSKLDIEKAFKCVSVIAAHGHWPKELQIGSRVVNIMKSARPLLDDMMGMTHRESFELGLEYKAFELISGFLVEEEATLQESEEYRRQVNAVLEPLFFAEIVVHVSPTVWHANNQAKSYPGVRDRIPWCKDLENPKLGEFQQAAAFEWLLEEIRNKPGFPDDSHYGLGKFAKSGNPKDLPYDFKFVRWPMSLLDWYIQAIDKDQVTLTPDEQDQVEEYITLLRKRLAAQNKGQFPLPPHSPEFRRVHFELLQPGKLEFDTITIVTLTLYRCRCARDPIGKFTRPQVEFLSNSAIPFINSVKADTLSSIQKMKKTEADKWTAKMKWKRKIGVHPGEGTQRTGLRRLSIFEPGSEEGQTETLASCMPEISSTTDADSDAKIIDESLRRAFLQYEFGALVKEIGGNFSRDTKFSLNHSRLVGDIPAETEELVTLMRRHSF